MIKKYMDNSSYQSFFTHQEDILKTMTSLLGDVTDGYVLEPCVGDGAFLKNIIGKPKKITAIDIDENNISKNNIEDSYFINMDYIDYNLCSERYDNIKLKYNYVICNPPYGLKFSSEYRKLLKKRFPNIYVRESYALFFYFAVQNMLEDGRYVFIMPDSFMTSKNLEYLRKFIVSDTILEHIIQFKSKRFGSVNFGYSNMCILSGRKSKLKNPNHKVVWIDARNSELLLYDMLNKDVCQSKILYKDLIDSSDFAWIHPSKYEKVKFSRETVELGDIAECKTGIYTGDNINYCGFDVNNPPKRINSHPVNWKYVKEQLSANEKKYGIDALTAYVPFIRGGHRGVFERTNSCIRWDREAVAFYAQNKKSRLQNKEFYFRRGIAIPMVTSGKLTASEINESIFDQGVVGVFSDEYHDFLLIYLNTEFATMLKDTICSGSNNSANYIKRIKVPILTKDEKDEASNIITIAKKNGWENTAKLRNDFIHKFILNT